MNLTKSRSRGCSAAALSLLLPTARFASWPIAFSTSVTWIRNLVNVFAACCLIGLRTSRIQRFTRRLGRDQAIASVANQILPTGLDECLPHSKPVFRLEKLHQRPLHLSVPKSFGDIDFLAS